MTTQPKPTIYVKRTYTSDDFEQLPEFDGRFELIDGRIVVRPMPIFDHGWIARRLMLAVSFFDPKEVLGAMVFDISFRIASGYTPIPDLAYVVASRIIRPMPRAYPGPPDIAVEIHSPHNLDSQNRYEEALQKYRTANVPIVWAINPETHLVEVYHPDQSVPLQVLGVGDELEGENIIPGFKIKIADLFA